MGFLKDVFTHFSNSNTFQKGASLAYYAVFSLLPMIIIIVSILGILFGKQAVSGEIYTVLKDTLGGNAALQIQDIIKKQHTKHNNLATAIIGFITLALSATGMFNQLHGSLNSIWHIRAKPRSSLLHYFSRHLTSFLILLTLFSIIFISTSINAFLVHHANTLPYISRNAYIMEHVVSFILLVLVFTLLFKFLGDARVDWRVSAAGGLATSILFIFGKIAIGLYIGHSHISSTFGSASVMALVMIWVYYTSQILFFGASFMKVLSDRTGFEILPSADAVRIDHIELDN